MEPPELLLDPPAARALLVGSGTYADGSRLPGRRRDLTEAEWRERFGETAYRPACP
ncbi:hypothetical protein [Nonomuraea insulae]|uniref:Uncharacterized protein n=1 Tax=Nonomuraea insulae TaxID=1616787 RepID=A0ABW1DD22_9ACTN